ncbi:DUF1793-domain-containing protein [Mycena albidolilacea]|uniref:DUF1793-domain-containing protein n=1 Tax=Mycena albidolilacea TaxID=1033008 RepID=A0AAD7AUS5_9AGAR|nr:DUF1793-domain-containing protein [Mycena albidolilacea]
MRSWIYASSLVLATVVQAITWTATPFNPASIPLAVRTPYLSAWLPQGTGAALNQAWPTFWTGSTLGWAGFVKVDGTNYAFLGIPAVSGTTFSQAVQRSSVFTSTQSIFVLSAGPVNITVTFLSPVEPTDLVKQSIPFSYLSVSAAATDGKSHTVQVYSDISAEWVSGDNSLTVNWNSTTSESVLTHQVQLSSPSVFTENSDHTQYGSAFYSTTNTVGATYQTGSDVSVRAQFLNNGKLANTLDTGFRAISNNWPVFGLAHDLGTITTATAPVVFSVGHIRDPAIQYIVAGGALQSRSLYFLSSFSTPAAVISSFLGDYSAALSRANTFDAKVQTDASKISADYASIVALSIRQAFSATELTISKTSTGAFNTTDVILFMKEISSDGNVNTVDVIFPAWPIFLYTNPALGKYLLEGLFRYQASGQYPNKWSVHDLGSSYPKALGHNDGLDEKMPVEESGNMIIMALSYAQKTGDLAHLQRYTALLDQWTQFLIEDSLLPGDQISTDDFAGSLANQTNLAIKGIVGIGAMAQIESLLGNTAKSTNYSSIATSYVTQWQKFATSTTGAHLTLSYGSAASWGLSYNLYADKLLKLNLFPAAVYSEQTAWYASHANAFGVPLDTRHTYTKSDWQVWTAAIVSTTAVRDLLIGGVKKFVSDGQTNVPFSDLYDTISGADVGFRARPVVGGHLALLAL